MTFADVFRRSPRSVVRSAAQDSQAPNPATTPQSRRLLHDLVVISLIAVVQATWLGALGYGIFRVLG